MILILRNKETFDALSICPLNGHMTRGDSRALSRMGT